MGDIRKTRNIDILSPMFNVIHSINSSLWLATNLIFNNKMLFDGTVICYVRVYLLYKK